MTIRALTLLLPAAMLMLAACDDAVTDGGTDPAPVAEAERVIAPAAPLVIPAEAVPAAAEGKARLLTVGVEVLAIGEAESFSIQACAVAACGTETAVYLGEFTFFPRPAAGAAQSFLVDASPAPAGAPVVFSLNSLSAGADLTASRVKLTGIGAAE